MTAALVALALLLPPAEHQVAARMAALEHRLEPELLMAIAWHETRHTPPAVSTVRRRQFCGVMQTRSEGPAHCEALRAPLIAYRHGGAILRAWLRVTRGDLAAALNGYGCGFHGVRNGCNRFAERVLALRDRFRGAHRW